MRKIPSVEERRKLFNEVAANISEHAQTYPRAIAVSLRNMTEYAHGLLSYLSQPQHADNWNEALHYFVTKENTIWGQPCTYELVLYPNGVLYLYCPVGETALRRAFHTDDWKQLERWGNVAGKMVANGSESFTAIEYLPELRKFRFEYK